MFLVKISVNIYIKTSRFWGRCNLPTKWRLPS